MIRKSIPSLITCLNLCCGLLAIMVDDLRTGVFLVILGGVFDVFDGFAARKLNVSSEIGAQLDSLADIVSFGVAPAILFYKAYGGDDSFISILAPILIVVAGALRLARFNVQKVESDYFEGLAIPSSGLFFCGLVIAKYYGDVISDVLSQTFILTTALAAMMSLLNISTIKMFSFKQFNKSQLVKIYFGILIFVLTGALYFHPYSALSVTILVYVVLALLDHFILKSEEKIVSVK